MGAVWIVAVLAVGYAVWKGLITAKPEDRKRRLRELLGYAVTVAASWAAFRSGTFWLLGVIALLFFGLRAGPAVARRYKQGQSSSGTSRAERSAPMTRAEALGILGLKEGATQIEINERYRELMRKVHPDQGGTEFLATQLNQAKRVLLNEG